MKKMRKRLFVSSKIDNFIVNEIEKSVFYPGIWDLSFVSTNTFTHKNAYSLTEILLNKSEKKKKRVFNFNKFIFLF